MKTKQKQDSIHSTPSEGKTDRHKRRSLTTPSRRELMVVSWAGRAEPIYSTPKPSSLSQKVYNNTTFFTQHSWRTQVSIFSSFCLSSLHRSLLRVGHVVVVITRLLVAQREQKLPCQFIGGAVWAGGSSAPQFSSYPQVVFRIITK